MAVGRVNLALGADRLDWTPTWTRVDSVDNLVSGFDISRGKQTEENTTDTSTAIVYLHDRAGYFDPAYLSSPFAGYLGSQILLQVWDPQVEEWVQQARMWVDHVDFNHNPATVDGTSIVSNVQLNCIDIFGLLSRISIDVSEVVGARVFGDTPPAGREGVVYYAKTDPGDSPGFDDRIRQILSDCGIPSDWYVVFTGNVDLLEGVYDVGEGPLLALSQAVDAEMPGLGQHYSDKLGRYVAHGRRARFEPSSVWSEIAPTDAERDAVWKFRRWYAGDGAAVAADGTRAQIRPPLGWTYSEEQIRNVGYCYPKQTQVSGVWQAFPDNLKPGQVFVGSGVDPVDRRVWKAEGLLTKAGTTTLLTGAEECRLFGEFWATQLSEPVVHVDQVTFMSYSLDGDVPFETWGLMLNADISDILNLEHGYAGGVGLHDDYYVEGSEMSVRPLNPTMDLVTVTFNLSPAVYYSSDMGLLG